MDYKNIILKGLSDLQNEMNNASGGLFERLKNVEIENGNLQQKNQKLEQALDEIEKYIENHKKESKTRIYGLEIPEFIFNGNIEDIEKIIQKAKGDVKNEN